MKHVNIMECIKAMETNQSILIRNKKDAQKLSKSVAKYSEEMRKERFLEAIQNEDSLYLSTYYNSFSIFELLKMILKK